jgi:hypothetical protein
MTEVSDGAPENSGVKQPALAAALLLLAFIVQCLLAILRIPSSESGGLSALMPRAAALLIGTLLGASIWYVGRRLYGASGALIALALYCFSPHLIAQAAGSPRMGLATWGFFGTIFVGMATAHTLYAAPGVLAPSQRILRPVMMGAALGVGSYALPAVALAAPLALGFMLYLAPRQRRWATLLWLLACVEGALVFAGLQWLGPRIPGFDALATAGRANDPSQLNPVLLFISLIALAVWIGWRRARFFGNTAPLVSVAAYAALLASILGDRELWAFWAPSAAIWNPALPMLFMFIGGVFADLLETRWHKQVTAATIVLLVAYAAIGVLR